MKNNPHNLKFGQIREWDPSCDLTAPLKWRKKPGIVRISCDVFGDLAEEDRDAVFAVAALCPAMTFLLATENARGMAEWFARPGWISRIMTAIRSVGEARYEDGLTRSGPFSNLILGVTIRDQAEADERVPWLLRCPAACRLVDVRPRGAIDLKFSFSIKCEQCGSERSGYFGCPDCRSILQGKFGPRINWLTVSGSSDPMHPSWVRGLRDQCVAAGVPFCFEGYGDWRPKLPAIAGEPEPLATSGAWGTLERSGKWWPQTSPWNGRQDSDSDIGEFVMVRVGAARSGRILDGRTWDEMPKMGEEK